MRNDHHLQVINVKPSFPGTSIPCDDDTASELEGSLTGEHSILPQKRGQAIGMLSDDALLEIFDFCRKLSASSTFKQGSMRWWETLVHVCRQWRNIILASSRRLDLHITCDHTTLTRMSLMDIWPPFPITIEYHWLEDVANEKGEENIIAALEHRDRIADIFIVNTGSSQLERLVPFMQEPLVALRRLNLVSCAKTPPILPEAFLGGSTPSLRSFFALGVAFPALPRLLSSARELVDLHLQRIPHSGYIAPDMITTCLAALPHLKSLTIDFESHQSRPIQTNPPLLTRVVLPSLTFLVLAGVGEYFEDLVSRIDTPLLNNLFFIFLDPGTHIQQICQFISRTETLKPFNRLRVEISSSRISIGLGGLNLDVEVFRPELLIWLMAWLFRTLSSLLSCVERLDIRSSDATLQCDVGTGLWFELFRPFIAVQSLYVSKAVAPLVTLTLQGLTGDRATDVLPVLRELFLEGFEPSGCLWEAIQSFVAARQLSNYPVTVKHY